MSNKSITAANAEQELAIKSGIAFIEKGNPDEWFVIGGKAGTGKTTIAQAILEKFVGKRNILVCALSHKAKLVIAGKLEAAFSDKKINSKSVAGALGMNMDQETGKFISDKNEYDPPIKRVSIIVVDEASMINEESHQLIMTEKQKRAKVIFLGDIRQLPPIREGSSVHTDKPSPVFYGKNYVVLNERIRQGEESPILPFADYFGDNSRRLHPLLNPVPIEARKCQVTEKGALVFAENIYEVIETALPLYRIAIDTASMNIVKTVTYRNETRKRINNLVRENVFGAAAEQEFTKGDLLMFQDNFSHTDFDEPISNSYELQVISAAPKTETYKLWSIEFVYEAKPCFVDVLDHTEKKRHETDVSRLFEIAKALPKGETRREALSKAWGLKKRYAPLEYAYAITSHKSQGSTYNTVIVDEKDITNIAAISCKQKSQSMYTALTRASHSCIVIDGKRREDMVQQAVDYSLQILK
jgi:exodeoxyribonuclease V